MGRVPGRVRASGARRLIGDSPGPLGDGGEVVLALISSWVSKCAKAPELMIARVAAAWVCESGISTIAIPSCCPNIQ